MANKPGEANFFPDVPVYPEIGTFQPIYGKFDLTTYIQGASDYEIMAFLVGKYNATLEAYGTVTKLSTDTVTACKQLQDWINNWFDNLDVQEELNKKIDSMVADGTFGTLLHQTFDAQINQQTTNTVTAWLVANVTPTGSAVVVDKSLSIEGAAADAKATGTYCIGNGIVPIQKYGAVGDGTTDDYSAFQTAINDKSVKEITLEPKTYLIKTILRITDRNAIKITGNGATIKFEVGDAVNLNDYCFEAANMTGLIIENCTFDGGYTWIERPLHTADNYQNYLDIRAKTRHAFRLTNCTQFTINNVAVQNTLAGFWLTGCTYGCLTNCKSLNTIADSVFLVGSHNISVNNHYSDNIDDDSYVSINYSSTASNFANSFDNCYTNKGFGALCCFYGSYSATIRNSRIDSCSYTPLKLGVHNPYHIAGSHQIVENCTIHLTENIDNYTNNVLNICEGISSAERADDITLNNVSLIFAKSDGYTIRFVNTNNININSFSCNCNFEMTNCQNANITNSTLTTVTFSGVTRVPIKSSSLTNISAINVSRLISLGNSISASPAITFNGTNNLCTIDNNSFTNNGNNHFLMTTNSLLPANSPHLAFLVGTVLHSGGNLIYVTNTGFKILATD